MNFLSFILATRAQIWVYGNSFESFLVAVAVPNQQALENWANSNGEEGDYATLCKSPKAQKFILSELTNMGKKKGVSIHSCSVDFLCSSNGAYSRPYAVT